MRKLTALIIAATFIMTACAREETGTVEIEPSGQQAADLQQEQDGETAGAGTTLKEVQEETREALQTTRDYARRITADLRDDVENELNQAGDDLRQLKQEAQTSQTARELERELQDVRQDFNRLSREAQQIAGETSATLQQEWQELEERVDELSVDIRAELRTRENADPDAGAQ